MMISIPPRDTSLHQYSTSIAPSGTPLPAQSPPPPQTRGTQSHSAPTHSNGQCSLPQGGPDPGSALGHVDHSSTSRRSSRSIPFLIQNKQYHNKLSLIRSWGDARAPPTPCPPVYRPIATTRNSNSTAKQYSGSRCPTVTK